MQNRKLEQLRQEEQNRIWKDRGDRFWGAFLFTKDGKVKSTLLLYSFCLSVVFAVVYVAAYVIFVNLLHPMLEGASAELPRQVVCPPAVFHIHRQGVVAGGQGVITAHFFRFFIRSKTF